VAKTKVAKKTKAAAPKAAASVPAKARKAEVKTGVVEDGAVDKPFDPAAWMHQRIVHQIMEFEKNLGPDHEIGGRFVEGPNNESLHITNVASWGPDMILFMGEWSDGRKFELIQHYSQVSVLLTAVKKQSDEPRRIGFEMMKTVKEQDVPWEDPIT
jgi:Family of unknown function (DUF6173)